MLADLLSESYDADLEESWDGEWSWLYAAIDFETKLILDVALFGRHGTDPAAAFLHRLDEKYGVGEIVFLVD